MTDFSVGLNIILIEGNHEDAPADLVASLGRTDMSIPDIKQIMIGRIEELFASISGNSSDADCHEALKRFQMDHYNDLASLSFWLGCDAGVFQRECVAAADLVDDAYFEIMREREFEAPTHSPVYSTLNARQQFGSIIRGAQL